MGYLERNSETWKTPGFSGFECRVSGIGWVRVTKQLGYSPQVLGFRVQRPITICAYKYSDRILPVLCQYSTNILQHLCQYSASS